MAQVLCELPLRRSWVIGEGHYWARSEEVLHALPYPGVGMGTSTHSEVGERSDRFHRSVSTVAALLVICYQVKKSKCFGTPRSLRADRIP